MIVLATSAAIAQPRSFERGAPAEFVACPLVTLRSSEDASQFWSRYESDPKPYRLVVDGVAPIEDFVGKHGRWINGDYMIDDMSVDGEGSYRLSAEGYTPNIIQTLRRNYPLPDLVQSIDMRPVFSIGSNGPAERDIAHHFHTVTAMRLLQGRKIWGLRSPFDPECMMNTGTCTDPFDICDYYERPTSPAPACVHEAGETLILPDGWFHGTCNNATVPAGLRPDDPRTWTIGWGGQGTRWPHKLPGCYHCRSRRSGQLSYASTAAGVFVHGDATRLIEAARQSGFGTRKSNMPIMGVGPAGQAPLMVMRSVHANFVHETQVQSEASPSFPECNLWSLSKLGPEKALSLVRKYLKKNGDRGISFSLANLHGPPPTLALRHRASGEVEHVHVPLLRSAFWWEDALVGVKPAENATAGDDLVVFCRCGDDQKPFRRF